MAIETRVVHYKREAYDIYIGRPGPWGNPYTHLPSAVGPSPTGPYLVGSREEAIECYRAYLAFEVFTNEVVWRERLAALHGKTLGCWCAPQACHGDVLARAAAWATSGEPFSWPGYTYGFA